MPSLLSIFEAAVIECWQRSFEDIHHRPVNPGIFDGPGKEIEVVLSVLLVDRDMDDLLCIGNNGEIRVVRYKYNLASLLGLLDKRD